MTGFRDLTHSDKVFLAGCIRAIILANGKPPTASELADLDRINRKLDFADYETCLEEFEREPKDEATFMKKAARVTSHEAQDLILGVAYELSLQNGVPNDSQESIEKKLRVLWTKP